MNDNLIRTNKKIIDNMKMKDMLDFNENAFKQHIYFTNVILNKYFKAKLKRYYSP